MSYSAFSIKVNGEILSLPGYYLTNMDKKQTPTITYVPLKAVVEALNGKVSYKSAKEPLTVSFAGDINHIMYVTVGSSRANIDGITIEMEGQVLLKDGVVIIPRNVLNKVVPFTVEISKVGTPKSETILRQENLTSVEVRPSREVDVVDRNWVPHGTQKVFGKAIFEGITWEPSTRTITTNIPSTISVEGLNYSVKVAAGEGMARPFGVDTDKKVVISDLSDSFQIHIVIQNQKNKSIDWFTIQTEYFHYNNIDQSRGLGNTLLVKDAYDQLTELNTLYQSLGINH